MKWFFRITLGVIALFIGLAVIGALMPRTQVIERTASLDAPVGTLFDRINDLSTHPGWSHVVPADGVVFGQMSGVSASAAWDNAGDIGSAEILQASDDQLVMLAVQSGEDADMLTYLLQDDGDATTVLLRQERDLGGFPFVGRLTAKIGEGRQGQAIDVSLAKLAD